MSIITFANFSQYETGQTLMAAAYATCLGIEHNYKILLMTTDFNDKTLENSFWNGYQKDRLKDVVSRNNTTIDTSTGYGGLSRVFGSSHASGEAVASYAKPVFKDRLDIIPAPNTVDFKDFLNMNELFTQVADVGNKFYDVIIVDLYRNLPEETKKKFMDMSTVTLYGLRQNFGDIKSFLDLRMQNEYFRSIKMASYVSRYQPTSKFTAKNISRYIGSKELPFYLPDNILFTDCCSEGQIVDYILRARTLTNQDSPDFKFYKELKDGVDRLDKLRRDIEFAHY